MLVLTKPNGERMYVNPLHLTMVEVAADGRAWVRVTDFEYAILVQESANQVYEMFCSIAESL